MLKRVKMLARHVTHIRAMYRHNSTTFEVSGSPVAELGVGSDIRQGFASLARIGSPLSWPSREASCHTSSRRCAGGLRSTASPSSRRSAPSLCFGRGLWTACAVSSMGRAGCRGRKAARAARYLGVLVGTVTRVGQWCEVAAKITARAKDVVCCGASRPTQLRLFAMHITSLVRFRAHLPP